MEVSGLGFQRFGLGFKIPIVVIRNTRAPRNTVCNYSDPSFRAERFGIELSRT